MYPCIHNPGKGSIITGNTEPTSGGGVNVNVWWWKEWHWGMLCQRYQRITLKTKRSGQGDVASPGQMKFPVIAPLQTVLTSR